MLFIRSKLNNLKDRYNTIEERTVFFLLSINILIDFINGFLDTYHISVSLGQIVRALYMIIALYYIFRNSSIKNHFVQFMIAGIVFFGANSFLNVNNVKQFMFNADFNFRMAYCVIILTAMIILIEQKKITTKVIKDGILANSIFMFFFMIITYVLHIGDSSYSGNIGYKGVFISLNSLSISTIILFAFVVDKLVEERIVQRKLKIFYLVIFLGLLFIIFNLATKAGYAFTLAILVFYSVVALKKVSFGKLNWKRKQKIIFAVAILIIIGILYIIFREKIDRILSRQIFLFNLYKQNKSNFILSYLVSGRDVYLNAGLQIFNQKFNVTSLLIGIGANLQQHGMIVALSNIGVQFLGKNIEMDIFDIFISNGLLGVMFIYGYTVFLFIKGLRRNRFSEKKIYILSVVTILVYSVLGGHVYTTPMSTTILIACLAGGYISMDRSVANTN